MTVATARVGGLLALLVLAAACESNKSANPLSPSVAGPIPGVEISAPKPLEPGANWEVSNDKQPLALLIENPGSNGQRPVTLEIEVASDEGFSTKVFTKAGVEPGPNGRTQLQLPVEAHQRPHLLLARQGPGRRQSGAVVAGGPLLDLHAGGAAGAHAALASRRRDGGRPQPVLQVQERRRARAAIGSDHLPRRYRPQRLVHVRTWRPRPAAKRAAPAARRPSNRLSNLPAEHDALSTASARRTARSTARGRARSSSRRRRLPPVVAAAAVVVAAAVVARGGGGGGNPGNCASSRRRVHRRLHRREVRDLSASRWATSISARRT